MQRGGANINDLSASSPSCPRQAASGSYEQPLLVGVAAWSAHAWIHTWPYTYQLFR